MPALKMVGSLLLIVNCELLAISASTSKSGSSPSSSGGKIFKGFLRANPE
jgi:hypothetical protein